MPCDTRRTTTVKLEAADRQLLIAGLKTKGFQVREYEGDLYISTKESWRSRSAILRGDQLVVNQTDESIINEIKRAYSHEIVRTQAKRFGWMLTQNKQDENNYNAKRRF